MVRHPAVTAAYEAGTYTDARGVQWRRGLDGWFSDVAPNTISLMYHHQMDALIQEEHPMHGYDDCFCTEESVIHGCPTHDATVTTSPDCRDGNHIKCDGAAWDLATDAEADCACGCHPIPAAA